MSIRRTKQVDKTKQGKFPILSKKQGIGLYFVIALIGILIILLHQNVHADPTEELIKKCISCVVIVGSMVIFARFYDKFTGLPVELWQNRELIWKLAKNDFKKRYAGSYLGIVWAMIQPIVTVGMYFIVFGVIMKQRAGMAMQAGTLVEVPYVLYLTAGLVPWFFFTEALNGGTMALIEYNYLVKKVVFKISILPIIKIIGALFVHVCFIVIMLIVGCFFGFYPTAYTLQIFYYTFCLFILVLGMSYATSAIVIFFRDLQQIVAIVLQLGMWATPIMWDMSGFDPTV
ncbi:MAG: ABC transporter permease, partial [Lachnospiraceae bacterium]|nr:ABC transporter permease [Lachnospiraceae bacterium]